MKYTHFAYVCLFIFFILGLTSLRAQQSMIDPVKWYADLTIVEEGKYRLGVTAETEPGWVIYSQFIDDDGPIPTSFEVELPEGAQLIGDFKEPENGIKKMDEMFGMELTKYKGPATFSQNLTARSTLSRVTGRVMYMTCNDIKCLPPKEISFQAKLSN